MMPDAQPGDTEAVTLDLRSGRSIWELAAEEPSPARPLVRNVKTDVIIVGAGITGSFLAERLTRAGREVVVLDRHEPQLASTAASTALLQWEIDAPMLELEDRLGFDRASRIYRQSRETVRRIGALIGHDAALCGFDWRQSLYLAGNALDASELREEHRLRARAGIEGAYLTAPEIMARYGFQRDAALLHRGSAETDPMALAKLLLDRAIARGATVASPVHVTEYDCSALRVSVGTAAGIEVQGNALVLANGYEMPPIVAARSHRLTSTWVVATRPQPPEALWQDRCLVWEASQPYLYLRSTTDNRIIVGGEDEAITDARERDARMPDKAATLIGKLRDLLPQADGQVEAAWSGFFGATDDGLPLIGRVPGQPRCFAAFGYGGNGITYSALAADILDALMRGESHEGEGEFALDR